LSMIQKLTLKENII